MERNRLSLRDAGDQGRVGATLAVARYSDGLGSIGMGRHKGVPYTGPELSLPLARRLAARAASMSCFIL